MQEKAFIKRAKLGIYFSVMNNAKQHTEIEWMESLKEWQDFAVKWGTMSQDFWLTAFQKYGSTDWMKQPYDPYNLKEAWASYFDKLINHPEELQKAQADLIERFMQQHMDEPLEDQTLFDLIKHNYKLYYDWVIENMHDQTQDLNEDTRKKLDFFTRQFLDAFNPHNFAFTNPDVVQEIIDTNGENLVKGLNNLIHDMKRSQDFLPKISTANEEAFSVGENIALTEGEVIFRNEMMELIQYAPKTKEVYKTPILITPPWINKYYILDLRPEKSMVEWLLEQGHQVFMISWKNPNEGFANKTFDDYAFDGCLKALDIVEDITQSGKTHMLGYCIGGTLLSMVLSYLKTHKQDERIATATFLTTLLDFQQAGDLKLFIDEQQISHIEDMMKDKGVLSADALKATFNMLRANDLIWSFVVNNYLLGKDPLPFDLLYWNNDSTNLPAAMHSYYLRNMYLHNRLIEANALKLDDTAIDISKIDVPCFFLSTKDDHIAPWVATYSGAKILNNHKDSEFVLAGSGHIAGVVNPPARNKYGYHTNKDMPNSTTEWLDGSAAHEGSWWPHWHKWLTKHHKAQKQAPKSRGNKEYKPLCPAPGEYVLEKAN